MLLNEALRLSSPQNPTQLKVWLGADALSCSDNSYILSSTENSDFIPLLETRTFDPISQEPQCALVFILDDTVLENSEVFFIQLNTTDPDITVMTASSNVAILDNDSMFRQSHSQAFSAPVCNFKTNTPTVMFLIS